MKILRAVTRKLQRNAKHENPSVADYKDKRSLMCALGGRRPSVARSDRGSDDGHSVGTSSNHDSCSISDDEECGSRCSGSFSSKSNINNVEWTLPLMDKEVTEPQTMEEELKRLQTLQSYFILDSEGEAEFDRITRMGSKLFDAPICLISLVDLGRQWFLSKVGLDADETPRKYAFCAHVIANKFKIMVVPDATQDFRFKDNPLVQGGPKIRFYAGAALVSPEGYKLGTVCVISPKTRPQGLNAAEQELLHDMAGLAVSAMVARRNRLLREEYETKFHGLAKTFMDTNTKLEDGHKTIDTVLARHAWDMDAEDELELNALSRSLNLQSKVCAAASRNIVHDTPLQQPNNNKSDDKQADEEDGFLDSMLEYDRIVDPTTDMQKLFDNINTVCSNFPHGEVTMELHKSVPKFIVAEDLLLFRSTLNLLTHCMGASKEHRSGMRIRTTETDGGNELLVQCVQGGTPVSGQKAKQLFADKDSLLAPVATMVRSLDGRFGMFEGRWERHQSQAPVQSIYWFRIPFGLPEGTKKLSASDRFSKTQFKVHKPEHQDDKQMAAALASERKGMGVDPFQKPLLIDVGCGTSRMH